MVPLKISIGNGILKEVFCLIASRLGKKLYSKTTCEKLANNIVICPHEKICIPSVNGNND